MSEILHIIVCDDDQKFLTWEASAIQSVMHRLRQSAMVHSFQAGEQIPDALLKDCALAFLDIDFPRKSCNGIDIARRLRARNSNAVIVFVTNYVEYAPEGYEVQAFRYLLKREAQTRLEPCLTLALEQLQLSCQCCTIQSGGETLRLPIRDILYFESDKHTVVAHVQNGSAVKTYSFYASLRSLEESMQESGFLRIQKSYLVNMRHLQKFQCKEAVLSGGTVLPVSEKNYAEQKKKYLLWKGRQ